VNVLLYLGIALIFCLLRRREGQRPSPEAKLSTSPPLILRPKPFPPASPPPLFDLSELSRDISPRAQIIESLSDADPTDLPTTP
jgi:hypothetical protein